MIIRQVRERMIYLLIRHVGSGEAGGGGRILVPPLLLTPPPNFWLPRITRPLDFHTLQHACIV